jgi:hypothetical protein
VENNFWLIKKECCKDIFSREFSGDQYGKVYFDEETNLFVAEFIEEYSDIKMISFESYELLFEALLWVDLILFETLDIEMPEVYPKEVWEPFILGKFEPK